MPAPIIAYADEYPWMRCTCGYTLNMDPDTSCPGCGREKSPISYRDRFGHGRIKDGITYENVPYEDCNRASHLA